MLLMFNVSQDVDFGTLKAKICFQWFITREGHVYLKKKKKKNKMS